MIQMKLYLHSCARAGTNHDETTERRLFPAICTTTSTTKRYANR